MAHRHWVACSALMVSAGLFGCQSNNAVVELPPPSFAAPQVVAVAPIKPLYVPTVTPAPLAVLPAPTPLLPAVPPRIATVLPSQRDWLPPVGVAVRPWKWIVIHHSATPTGGAVAFDKMHRAKGWDELGYDFVIGNGTDTADGQVEVGSRWVKQKIGAHAKTPDNRFNEFGIGICLVGNFDVTRPTAKQMKSVEKLCAFLMKQYHIPASGIYGHRDTKSTDCPGNNTNLALIRQQAAAMAGVTGLADARAAGDGELLVAVPR